jgi:hypothetical protein
MQNRIVMEIPEYCGYCGSLRIICAAKEKEQNE